MIIWCYLPPKILEKLDCQETWHSWKIPTKRDNHIDQISIHCISSRSSLSRICNWAFLYPKLSFNHDISLWIYMHIYIYILVFLFISFLKSLSCTMPRYVLLIFTFYCIFYNKKDFIKKFPIYLKNDFNGCTLLHRLGVFNILLSKY